MTSIGNITFACENPDTLADFWAAALDYEKEEAPPDFIEALVEEGADPDSRAAISDPDDTGPRLFFQKKSKTPTDVIPIHLDLNTTDRDAEVTRLIELGARKVETKTNTFGSYTETWTVMKDPENNGFCVQAPDQ